QDGLLSTVGLLSGVSVATQDRRVIVITGVAAGVTGGISMATGSYLAARTERDIFRTRVPRPGAAGRQRAVPRAGGVARVPDRGRARPPLRLPSGRDPQPARGPPPAHRPGEGARPIDRRSLAAAQGGLRDVRLVRDRRAHPRRAVPLAPGHGHAPGGVGG